MSVRTVHLIFKTHLDIGFTDFSRNVVSGYFTDFIPRAMQIARAMRESGTQERFIWTTGSWLVYEYLEQASHPERQQMEAAIEAGDIVWHGLPFTTHSELMDASLFRYGLSLSQRLDRRFGKKTIAAKMTDVPGHTRGIVPLLAEAGIEFLHLGVNPASAVPDVPPLFVWQDAGGASVMVMYHASYGKATVVPEIDEAIAFAHTNDNEGPQSADEIHHAFDQTRAAFPQASVCASTMDAFAAQLSKVKSQLPIMTQEIGDTWIHGVGTDPAKVSQFRELSRLRREWLDAGKTDSDDKPFDNFSRSLLMIPEHTWGLDEKTHLADYTHYEAELFEPARSQPSFQKMEASWQEQRAYLTDALDVVQGTALREEANRRLATLKPMRPATAGFAECDPAGLFETHHFRLRFDPAAGAVAELVHNPSGRQWASADHQMGLLCYESFSEANYNHFYRHYIRDKRRVKAWAVDDYTKPGMTTKEHSTWLPSLQKLYHRSGAEGEHYLLDMIMPEAAYGAPQQVFLEAIFPKHEPTVVFDLQWFDKPAARLPEALWFSFSPLIQHPKGWTMDKLGTRISPLEVVRNGSRKLHAVGKGVYYADAQGSLTIESLDAPLVAPGAPSLLNFNNRQPDLRNGMHFNLYNNVWGTNFPMWYGEDAKFRFTLRF